MVFGQWAYLVLQLSLQLLHADEPPLVGNPSAAILFGRGSGWHGLDTVEIKSSGDVVLNRLSPSHIWETATLKIQKMEQQALFNSADTNRLMLLDSKYRNSAVVDGAQWVLLIRRDSISKCVYFDNSFPTAIKNFASAVDSVLNKHKIDWQKTPDQSRQHQKPLWDAVRQLPK